MDKHYDFKTKETEMYKLWEDNNLFSPEGVSSSRKKTVNSIKPRVRSFCSGIILVESIGVASFFEI